jgi:hypothetical protein
MERIGKPPAKQQKRKCPQNPKMLKASKTLYEMKIFRTDCGIAVAARGPPPHLMFLMTNLHNPASRGRRHRETLRGIDRHRNPLPHQI